MTRRVKLRNCGRWKYGPDANMEAMFSETYLRASDCPYDTDSRTSAFGIGSGSVSVDGKRMGQGLKCLDALRGAIGTTLDDGLDSKEMETSKMLLQALEGNVKEAILCSRWIREPEKSRRYLLKTCWPLSWLVQIFLSTRMRLKIMSNGSGSGVERLVENAVRDLGIVSQQLGRKKYMFGDEIRTIDVEIFACVSLLIWDPFDYRGIKSHFIGENSQLSNLTRHAIRMRRTLFPDWEELCKP